MKRMGETVFVLTEFRSSPAFKGGGVNGEKDEEMPGELYRLIPSVPSVD